MASLGASSGRLYRWAFDCGRWNPTRTEIGRAFAAIQEEEKRRILKFVFKEDAKRALVGRLLIRKCVLIEFRQRQNEFALRRRSSTTTAAAVTKRRDSTQRSDVPQRQPRESYSPSRLMTNADVILSRTDRGRPRLSGLGAQTYAGAKSRTEAETKEILASYDFDFNVSHSGDFAVLAAESRPRDVDDDRVADGGGNEADGTKDGGGDGGVGGSDIGSLDGGVVTGDESGGCLKARAVEPFTSVASLANSPSTSSAPLVGVDVMKVEFPKGKSSAEFFRLMRRQLTPNEWRLVEGEEEEERQMRRFYRFWCLKESYVKALGVGIGFEVGRLEFDIKDDLRLGSCCRSTNVLVDGQPEVGWRFEETLLDEDHCAAVATKGQQRRQLPRQPQLPSNCRDSDSNQFHFLTIEGLMQDLRPDENGNDDDEEEEEEEERYWKEFDMKPLKNA